MTATAATDSLAKLRPVENVRPGWWVQTCDEAERPRWDRVRAVLKGTHPPTGTRVVYLQGETPERWGMREIRGAAVLALTAREAKRAGLEGGIT